MLSLHSAASSPISGLASTAPARKARKESHAPRTLPNHRERKVMDRLATARELVTSRRRAGRAPAATALGHGQQRRLQRLNLGSLWRHQRRAFSGYARYEVRCRHAAAERLPPGSRSVPAKCGSAMTRRRGRRVATRHTCHGHSIGITAVVSHVPCRDGRICRLTCPVCLEYLTTTSAGRGDDALRLQLPVVA